MSMITFCDVSFCYGEAELAAGNRQDACIEGMSFDIRNGECVILCGRSGAGKSTVLRLINGLAPAFYEGTLHGSVLVGGRESASMPPEQRVRTFGVVFQDPRSQFFMNSVQDEIAFSAENIGLEPMYVKEKVREAAALLNIEPLLYRTVDTLSAGQKQRVAIAAALILSPQILILDEPISNLDSDGIEILTGLLAEIKKRGTTIIISEHRLHAFLGIANSFLHIENGRAAHRWTADAFCRLQEGELRQFGFRYPGMAELSLRTNHIRTTEVIGQPESAALKETPKRAAVVETSTPDPAVKLLEAAKIEPDVSRAALCVSNVTYLYRNGRYTECRGADGSSRAMECGIRNISLVFPQDSVTALTGKNGAGKTTLCKVLCGLLRQQSGSITLHGQKLSCAQRRRMSYFVMQDADYQLYSDSVINELLLGQKPSQSVKERAEEALELFRLQAVRNRHPASLSGGEKQRVVIAAAYCSEAQLFVFDEPTSGMDGEGLLSMAQWAGMLAQAGKTVVIITHDELLVELACDYSIRNLRIDF
ncbi:MAG: ABC transporter ATP-binding protein [Treponema sp.]|uniref:ABC transporter ATP-binding protein n=1 Tax=Treponema sp. TaxID=166 RepID=UPI003FA2F13F